MVARFPRTRRKRRLRRRLRTWRGARRGKASRSWATSGKSKPAAREAAQQPEMHAYPLVADARARCACARLARGDAVVRAEGLRVLAVVAAFLARVAVRAGREALVVLVRAVV